MKKILVILFLFIVLFNLKTEPINAALCPNVDVQCINKSARDSCITPCLWVVTIAGGGKGGVSWCQCQDPYNVVDGTIACGETCQTHASCNMNCPYCRPNGPGTGKVCLKSSVEEFDCATGGGCPTCHLASGSLGIDTAIGCIPVSNISEFMGWVLGWSIGIGGGISFLLIIYASFMIMTSQGIPERLNGGKELLSSAITGLVLLIFSVFVLRFIGIDILGLGLFGFGQ